MTARDHVQCAVCHLHLAGVDADALAELCRKYLRLLTPTPKGTGRVRSTK